MPGSNLGLRWAVAALALLIGRESPAATESVPVALRLVGGARLDADGLRLVEQTAGVLLATSGIKAEWRAPCESGEPCPAAVLVNLLPLWKTNDRNVCGEVVHDARTDAPIVLVYLNRNREVVDTMRSRSTGRTHPALATLDVGDLVGLTIAHELGHALGLPHGRTGVMKAEPSVDDVIALRQLRLVFTPSEGARMRLTAAALAKISQNLMTSAVLNTVSSFSLRALDEPSTSFVPPDESVRKRSSPVPGRPSGRRRSTPRATRRERSRGVRHEKDAPRHHGTSVRLS